ncbi:ead/Ea22-like family protein [Salmonella enterica subsp. enterica]|nr:ead/Ea22-like family protein [Salmonella enterica subsp. enterica]
MSYIDKQALREAAEKAAPGNWHRASSRFNGITVTPFSLFGEEVTLAHTVEKRDAEFIAAANPATVLALLDDLDVKEEQRANWFQMARRLGEDLDAAERCIAELDERLIEYAGIATREAHRVAGLEARAVSIPEVRITVAESKRKNLTWRELGAYNEGADVAKETILAAIRTAGIKIKGE